MAFTLLLVPVVGACGSDSPSGDEGQTTTSTAPPAARFVTPDGSDSGSCSADDPCLTFDRAYHTASPGESVEVAAGSYPAQTITADASKAGKPFVVIRPAAGAAVKTAYLEFDDVNRLEVRDVQTSGWYVRPGSDGVTLRNVLSRGAGSFITGASNVRVIDSEISGVDSTDGLQVKASGEVGGQPRDIVLDGLSVHSIRRDAEPSAHVECVQFTAGVRVRIRNSRFVDCSTQGVFFKEDLGGVIDDVVVENSWFGIIPTGTSTLIFDDGVANMVARYNSFAQSPRLGGGEDVGAISVYGNAGELSGCSPGVVYRHNVWAAAACDATDLTADPGFVNAAQFDLRLTETSAAIDQGDPESYPATDIDGHPRPLGSAPDAGAVELQ